MSFITSIGVARPAHCFDQDTIALFMEKVMKPDYTNGRKLKTIFKSSGIKTRHSVLNDYGKECGFSFFPNTPDQPFPSTADRIYQYRQHALPLSMEAIKNCLKGKSEQFLSGITHLIVVSCTGMYSPGLDIDLVKSLGLKDTVQRTCINFMGCYAAFNALKFADAICKADAKANVLIICVELCTLHFQHAPTEDNLLANALFADGAGAILVQATPSPGWNLIPEAFHTELAYNGQEHMAWNVGNLGFEMKLSTYVPDIIRAGIRKFTDSLLQQVDKNLHDIAHFAIHPGGKKILEVIEQELGLSKNQNEPAYAVLSQFGNMSSATIVFVLQHIVERLHSTDHHNRVLSFAFGPGLTLESMLLKIHYHA
jgi:predicted naringenin-chalcone synthase